MGTGWTQEPCLGPTGLRPAGQVQRPLLAGTLLGGVLREKPELVKCYLTQTHLRFSHAPGSTSCAKHTDWPPTRGRSPGKSSPVTTTRSCPGGEQCQVSCGIGVSQWGKQDSCPRHLPAGHHARSSAQLGSSLEQSSALGPTRPGWLVMRALTRQEKRPAHLGS